MEAGGAVVAILVDDVLAAGDVVNLVNEQRHAGRSASGRWTWRWGWAWSIRKMNSMQALLFSCRSRHVGVDDQDVAGLIISRKGTSLGWLKNRLTRRDPVSPEEIFVTRRVEPFRDPAGGHAQVVWELGAEELRGLVEDGRPAHASATALRNSSFAGRRNV